MPSSHLACDGSMEPVSCLYPPFHAASTIWFSENFYKFEKICKPVARRHVVGGIAQSPHGFRTISVRRMRRLHGNCTDIARFPYNLRTVSVRIYPRLPPRPRKRNRTMPIDNVNTYAIARSHLRCPKNRTANRRQIFCTASGANVN